MGDTKKAQAEIAKLKKSLAESSETEAAKHKKTKIKPKENTKAPKNVRMGDDVEIISMKQTGTVCSLPDSSGNLFVKVGIMKIKTNLNDIRLAAKPKESVKKPFGGHMPSKTMSLSPEIDVRGETVDSAEILIDKFLDDAVLSSVGVVRIIHGKGTGLLRKGIHTFLKSRPYVKSFRLGVFGEGDAGVTVVELK